MIHGDLKGVRGCSNPFTTVLTLGQPNILVEHFGHAVIADFGLATVTQNLDSVQSVSNQRGHTPRWAAPEVLTEGIFSVEADTFSFAMVMIEVCWRLYAVRIALADCPFAPIQVFTGAIPFSDKTSTMAVFNIIQGVRPPRPAHPAFTTELWALMERCWNQDPRLRPEVSEAFDVLCGT